MDRFLLDTFVISEARKGGQADPGVMTWLSSVRGSQLHLSLLVVGEIRQGVERLRRRDPVQAQLPAIDGVMAATAQVRRMILVTRNVVDVERSDVEVVNPFS